VKYSADDVQYALEMTRILHEPDRRIDTFGTTEFQFALISEPLDTIGQVRIRSGRIHAEKPSIIRPEAYQEFQFEGFGEQADAFSDWLKQHAQKIAILQYGFNFRKMDITEDLLHEQLEAVEGRLVEQTVRSGNPMSAVISGVDDTWEICLLRFTVEMISKSSGINLFDFRRRGLL
jgi:hypothetical protein